MGRNADKFEKKFGYMVEEDDFDTVEPSNNENTDVSVNGVRFMMISTDKLRMNKYNDILFSMDKIEEFAESIKSAGFDYANVIGVYELADEKGYYEIYSGHRRFMSAVKAGLSEVPCAVKAEPSEGVKVKELILANQNNRQQPTPWQSAMAIEIYKEKCLINEKDKRKKIAVEFGISESSVQRYESILRLAKPLQELTQYRDIPYYALSTATKLSEEKQMKLYDMIMAYINTKMNGEYFIPKDRVLAMIEDLKNGAEEKPKNVSNTKASDKKAISAIKSFKSIAKQKNIVWENPKETLEEIKELEKVLKQIKMSLEDSI